MDCDYKDRKRKEKMERCKEEVRRVQTGLKEIDDKEFLTPRQAAQYLGLCSLQTFQNQPLDT